MVQRTESTFCWPEWTVEFTGELRRREKDTRRRKKEELRGCVCTLQPGKWVEEGVKNSVAPWISRVYPLMFTPEFCFLIK